MAYDKRVSAMRHSPVKGRTLSAVGVLGVVGLASIAFYGANAQQGMVDAPSWVSHVSADGDISLPTDFAAWDHMGSWAVADPEGGVAGMHNVYASAGTMEHYRQTGQFPDGATLVKEVVSVDNALLPTGDAHWANGVDVWFVMVKDTEGRFSDNPLWGNGWGWALFAGDDPQTQTATDFSTDCLGCHIPAQDSDWIYVYAYPGLGERAQAYAPTGTE